MKPGLGDIFATCSVDTTAMVWTTDDDKKPLICKLSGHDGYVIALEWITGTDRIVTASWDHTIKESRDFKWSAIEYFKPLDMGQHEGCGASHFGPSQRFHN